MKGHAIALDEKVNKVRYIVFFALFTLIFEILFNLFGIAARDIVDFVVAFVSAGGGTTVFVALVKKSSSRLRKTYIIIMKCIDKGRMSWKTHTNYEIIAFLIRQVYPLVSNGWRGYIICFLLFCTPFAGSINLYKNAYQFVEACEHGMEVLLELDEEIVSEERQPEPNGDTNNVDSEESQPAGQATNDESADKSEADSEKEEYKKFLEVESSNEGGEVKQVNKEFYISEVIASEDIDRVVDLILYNAGEYVVYDSEVGNIEELIKQHLRDLSQGDVEYLCEIFPQKEEELTESEVYVLERVFLEKVEDGKKNGYIPNSTLLDEVIDKREGMVFQYESFRLASALSNNYLKYVLEYDRQERQGESRIYYSGMAILSGYLQLCYASSPEERQKAIDWIYSRYQEIGDMGLLENEERVEAIISCLDLLRIDQEYIDSLGK